MAGGGGAAGRCPFLRGDYGSIRNLLGGGSSSTELSASSVSPENNAAAAEAADRDPAGQTLLPAIATTVQDIFRNLDDLYSRSSSIRCPFWRRRAGDSVDAAALVLRFLLIRHKSLGVLDPLWDLEDGVAEGLVGSDALQPPGCKPLGSSSSGASSSSSSASSSSSSSSSSAAGDDRTGVVKNRHLPLPVVAESIRSDWISNPTGMRGYYITGRLNSTLYVDSCLFDGPDPDMPVRGLRKYLSAASHLFDAKDSRAALLDLRCEEGGGRMGRGAVEVRWRLDGTLMLPWRPRVRPWTGTTRYHLNEEGLVYLHEEEWDISVWEAFVCTVWPEVGERIWGPPAVVGEKEGAIEARR
uniref:Uncharacterized protein n=1 Tax=Odontella aurita TaxID=265563 RepID=A0A7S4JS18_9STRA